MKEKIAIRKKALANRKDKYFEITSKFFNPLIKILKKNKQNNNDIISLYYPSNYEVNTLTIFELLKKKKYKNTPSNYKKK